MCECCAKVAAERAEQVRAWLAESRIGSFRPVSVTVRRDEDSQGDEAWFFEMMLPDPEPGSVTWAVDVTDGINDLYIGIRDKAMEVGLQWPWYLRFRPETNEVPEEEVGPDDGWCI